MNFCYNCGQQLPFGKEKFCPKCGENLERTMADRKDEDNRLEISDTKGDVLGTGTSGTGNITGKEVAYTVQGNLLNFNISGGISKEFMEQFKNMVSASTQLESKISTEDNKVKAEEASTAKQQITTVLNEVKRIEKKEGTQIQEIKAGNLQISQTELILKEYFLKGNEHYYKKEYSDALKWYDKVLKIEPDEISALNNKGLALKNQGKIEEAIEWHDKALKIDSNDVDTLNNKGSALDDLGKYQEAIEWHDKALKIEPDDVYALNGKGAALCNLFKFQEAIEEFDKALKVDPNNVTVLNNKGVALLNLGRYEEAIVEYDKALEIDPNYVLALNNKRITLEKLGRHTQLK